MSESSNECPFCHPYSDRIVAEHPLAIALRDKYAVSPGHLLVCPRRHLESAFELTEVELEAILRLVQEAKRTTDRTPAAR